MTSFNLEKNKAFYDFLETQIQLFRGHLMVTQASKDEEAIHQMRVAIKRIRTIQKLKKNIGFPHEIPVNINEIIKTIFSTAGKLRDLQIQSALLKQYKKELKSSFSELENHLTETALTLNESMDSTLHEIDISDFDILAGQQGQLNEVDYQADIGVESLVFLTRKINKINQLLLLLSIEENVHELRKQLKQMFFILQFLSEQCKDNIFYGYDLKNLKRLTDIIGFWNDRDFFRQMMVHFISMKEENFVLNHPEYQILLYVIENEKQKFLLEIDLELYLELISLSVILNKGISVATPTHNTLETCSTQVTSGCSQNSVFQAEQSSMNHQPVL